MWAKEMSLSKQQEIRKERRGGLKVGPPAGELRFNFKIPTYLGHSVGKSPKMAHFLLFHFLPLSPTGIFFPPLKNELHFLPVMISPINRQSLITVYTFRTRRERELV